MRQRDEKRSFMRASITALAMLHLGAVELRAADGPECFSPHLKVNVCEKAREAQAGIARSLPMVLNSTMTMESITVFGKRLAFTIRWHLTKSEYDNAFIAANDRLLGPGVARLKAEAMATNGVCGNPPVAAFVRLGGEIQYNYATSDGIMLFQPLVSNCPR